MLGGASKLVAETDESMRHLIVRLERGNVIAWSSQPLDLRPEPSRSHSTSIAADYLAVAWPAAGVVVVLGDSSAIAIDAASGSVRKTFPLEFTGRESLEQSALDLVASRNLLLVTSTRRVWAIDDDLRPMLRYEPRFILAGAARLEQGRIVVKEYDFDSDRELVTQVLDL